MESMFNDIGLEWGLDKCATITISKGKIVPAENLILNENASINVLQGKDPYKFLGKLENFAQLDDEVFDQASKEYLKRLGPQIYPYLEKSRQPTHLPCQLYNTICGQLNGD